MNATHHYLPTELLEDIVVQLPVGSTQLLSVALASRQLVKILSSTTLVRRHVLHQLAVSQEESFWEYLEYTDIKDDGFSSLPFVYKEVLMEQMMKADDWIDASNDWGDTNLMDFSRWRLSEQDAWAVYLRIEGIRNKSRFLRWAAWTGQTDRLVRALLLDLSHFDFDLGLGLDAFVGSVSNNHLSVVALLLSDARTRIALRTNPNACTNCFSLAVERGFSEIVVALLKDDECFHPAHSDNAAFRLAAQNGLVKIARLLLADPRVDPTARNNAAIKSAARNGHTETVELILARPDIDVTSEDSLALRVACSSGYTGIVKLLLDDGRVDSSCLNNSPIYESCKVGHLEIVKLLLADPRVDPGTQDSQPLKSAAENGHLEIVKLLLATKVDPSAGNSSEWLCKTYSNGHIEIFKLLISDERVLSKMYCFPFLADACRDGHHAVVISILIGSKKFSTSLFRARLLLWKALCGNHYDVVKALLEHLLVNVGEETRKIPTCFSAAFTGDSSSFYAAFPVETMELTKTSVADLAVCIDLAGAGAHSEIIAYCVNGLESRLNSNSIPLDLVGHFLFCSLCSYGKFEILVRLLQNTICFPPKTLSQYASDYEIRTVGFWPTNYIRAAAKTSRLDVLELLLFHPSLTIPKDIIAAFKGELVIIKRVLRKRSLEIRTKGGPGFVSSIDFPELGLYLNVARLAGKTNVVEFVGNEMRKDNK
ncbi:UNVERIFIED_CONTAM: hypothetical protein HDU68_003045 [Siphonaria sp. JEL0065]|nr:hypothetical protein HDU68_003045 [Siphonaria sp. JEL0065]